MAVILTIANENIVGVLAMTLREKFLLFSESIMFIIGMFGCAGIAYLSFVAYTGGDPQGVVALSEYDAVSRVECGSKSMGLVVGCGDRVLLREIPLDSQLIEGHIYTYDAVNQSVIHRYLGCKDKECQQLIFHGDNNRVAEIISRDNVTYEVIGVYYD